MCRNSGIYALKSYQTLDSSHYNAKKSKKLNIIITQENDIYSKNLNAPFTQSVQSLYLPHFTAFKKYVILLPHSLTLNLA